MNKNLKCAVFISDEGFGHMVRQRAIISELIKKHPSIKITLFTSKNIFYLRIALGIITLILSYRIYRIIMQPIEFASIKEKRYEKITNRLEQLREAQLIFKSEYNQYANNFDDLVSFLQNILSYFPSIG